MKDKGLIFDIQGFSVHDGPGCRTIVFLKGCPLSCKWCSNPEGRGLTPEIVHYKDECVGDSRCIDACSQHAITMNDNLQINRGSCIVCLDHPCIDTCYYNALKMSGYYLTVDDLMKKIKRDMEYWGSNGGVTLSGGEPMLQAGFAKRVLQRCYDSYIHTALETSGYAPWQGYEDILDYLDWIFYDLKHMDDETHKVFTGVSNKIILENAKRLASSNKRMIFRIAIVPGFNDTEENIQKSAEFIRSTGRDEVNLLPFHRLGSSKYSLLGLEYDYKDIIPPSHNRLKEIREIFKSSSLKCYLGGETPF